MKIFLRNPGIFILLLCFYCVIGTGCKKYLDAKPDKKLVVISKLEDLQALLDYFTRVSSFDPGADEASADNHYVSKTVYDALWETDRRMYTWEEDHLFTPHPNAWSYSYDNVYRANTILDNIGSIQRTELNKEKWDDIKGQALVLRAKSFLKVAFTWSLAYDPSTASTDLGIPLRLDPDFNLPSVRASVEETYAQIIADLKEAIPLLPVKAAHVMRASRPAAYALLARAYLSMRRYDQAGAYADSSLQLYSTLMDYNNLNPSQAYPFPQFNEEVLMDNTIPVPTPLHNAYGRIDSNLYRSYAEDDLRKNLYFFKNADQSVSFKGNYSNRANLFGGVATDEVWLMRAEAHARAGRTGEAMADLNTLLSKRWKNGTFVPLETDNAEEALELVLQERRKELLMRGLRWMDIKRLNKEGAHIILKRDIGGQVYTLPPNDPRYALPIPEDVISLSGMLQNPR